MTINFDRALGIHEKALGFRSQRAEVLANNLANADTPNYKARDLDFASVLQAQQQRVQGNALSVTRTSGNHIAAQGDSFGTPGVLYSMPEQPSIDQNTVDANVEQAKYAQNALDFQASFTFLNSKLKGLMNAIRGE
ncbi:flagellar basal body rod protein FlgB [Stutzerimonas azotifigens]|uniref:flagellar basal body rod protein FlgB n=1 Tax=Stutzerimonas azotifigens TaxID=291995 RepID=UPI0004101070|nr:flagellar basal body rod protein FlgB [Stutzerimonas azotifigens]